MTLILGVAVVILTVALLGTLHEINAKSRKLRASEASVDRLVLQRDQALDDNDQLRLRASERARLIVRPAIPDGFLTGPADLPTSDVNAVITALEAHANRPRRSDPGA